jgi:hypothetical protein
MAVADFKVTLEVCWRVGQVCERQMKDWPLERVLAAMPP